MEKIPHGCRALPLAGRWVKNKKWQQYASNDQRAWRTIGEWIKVRIDRSHGEVVVVRARGHEGVRHLHLRGHALRQRAWLDKRYCKGLANLIGR